MKNNEIQKKHPDFVIYETDDKVANYQQIKLVRNSYKFINSQEILVS